MPIITTYQCSKCGKTWNPAAPNNHEQPVAIGIYIQFGATSLSSKYPTYQTFWCRECVMKQGLAEPVIDKDKKVVPEIPLTLEEKIILLLEELGFERS